MGPTSSPFSDVGVHGRGCSDYSSPCCVQVRELCHEDMAEREGRESVQHVLTMSVTSEMTLNESQPFFTCMLCSIGLQKTSIAFDITRVLY
jgi:hypothetical protein